LLVDGERTVVETSIIIEHLQLVHPGPVRLLPSDPIAALDVRFLDRFSPQLSYEILLCSPRRWV